MKHFFYRFFLLLFRLFAGCLLGSIILLFYASRSQLVHQEIKKSVKTLFVKNFDCDWNGEIHDVDLLSWHIEFSNVLILPCNQEDAWSLYSDKIKISGSWLHFLLYHRFSCHVLFEDMIVSEKQIDDRSHFMSTMSKMFSGSLPATVSFDYTTIKEGQFVVQDATGDVQTSCTYNCQMSQERDGLHTQFNFLDADFTYKNTVVFEKLYGNLVSIIPYDFNMQEIYTRVDCRLSIPRLKEKGQCFFVGDLYAGRGAFVVSNEDQSFIVEPLKFRFKKNSTPMTCSINVDSDILQEIGFNHILATELSGNSAITFTGDLQNLQSSIQGKIEFNDLLYKNNTIVDHAFFTFAQENKGYLTKFFVENEVLLKGLWLYNEKNWNFNVSNSSELQPSWAPYWKVPLEQGTLSGTIDSLYNVKADYRMHMQSKKLDKETELVGSFSSSSQDFKAKASFLDKEYECVVGFDPVPHLVKLGCSSEEETFIDLHEDQDSSQGTIGFVGFNFIKNLLSNDYKSSFSQPGKFNMTGNLAGGGYAAQVTTDNAHIRIPSLYNVIQEFKSTTTFDLIGRSITIDDMVMKLYEGTVRSDHFISYFDAQGNVSFLHAPLFLDSVLMSWHKGIFGVLSGKIFLSQQFENKPLLQGNLILDKAQLKGNIFSTEFQEQLLSATDSSPGFDIDCILDVKIGTKDPVIISTSFLEAKAHLDLHIVNNLKQPEIEGSIDLVSGELKFPYKSLFLTHGQIIIAPKNSTEPTIDFVAKGKVKRYDITMRGTGTMMDQQIHFESSPYLTEEQIVSLLILGSQDSSLNVVMPTILMQKLQEIVFGPALSQSKLDVLFHRLLQSFKNIRIFPQFTNQTGRGGVRGVVEVDATDRLHGRIDSNLMQLEDTIFEADYALTDDVTVRAIKDGPSTYGGEVEMRWKFS